MSFNLIIIFFIISIFRIKNGSAFAGTQKKIINSENGWIEIEDFVKIKCRDRLVSKGLCDITYKKSKMPPKLLQRAPFLTVYG
jgi:hypothetical protein